MKNQKQWLIIGGILLVILMSSNIKKEVEESTLLNQGCVLDENGEMLCFEFFLSNEKKEGISPSPSNPEPGEQVTATFDLTIDLAQEHAYNSYVEYAKIKVLGPAPNYLDLYQTWNFETSANLAINNAGGCLYGCSITLVVYFNAPYTEGEYTLDYDIIETDGISLSSGTAPLTVGTTVTNCPSDTQWTSWQTQAYISNGVQQIRSMKDYHDNPPDCTFTTHEEYRTVCDTGYIVDGYSTQIASGYHSCVLDIECASDLDCSGTDNYCHQGECLTGCEILTLGGVYTNCQVETGGFCVEGELFGGIFNGQSVSSGEVEIAFKCNEGYAYSVESFYDEGLYFFCWLSGSMAPQGFQTCTDTQSCLDGSCVQQQCTPNAEVCDGNQVKKCNADGSASSIIDTCNYDEECLNPSLYDAYCQSTTAWYCITENDPLCNSVTYGTKPHNNCWNTQQECLSAQSYCYNPLQDSCQYIFGTSCPSGQTRYTNLEDCRNVAADCQVWTCDADLQCTSTEKPFGTDCSIEGQDGYCDQGICKPNDDACSDFPNTYGECQSLVTRKCTEDLSGFVQCEQMEVANTVYCWTSYEACLGETQCEGTINPYCKSITTTTNIVTTTVSPTTTEADICGNSCTSWSSWSSCSGNQTITTRTRTCDISGCDTVEEKSCQTEDECLGVIQKWDSASQTCKTQPILLYFGGFLLMMVMLKSIGKKK